MEFSRPEYWSGYLFPSPAALPNPGVEPRSPALQADSFFFFSCRQILYQLSHKGSPRILEWVAYPSSIGPSRFRNQTRVSCIAGGFFSNWATRKAWRFLKGSLNVLWALLLNLVMVQLLMALPFCDVPMNRQSSLFLSCVTEVTPASSVSFLKGSWFNGKAPKRILRKHHRKQWWWIQIVDF